MKLDEDIESMTEAAVNCPVPVPEREDQETLPLSTPLVITPNAPLALVGRLIASPDGTC